MNILKTLKTAKRIRMTKDRMKSITMHPGITIDYIGVEVTYDSKIVAEAVAGNIEDEWVEVDDIDNNVIVLYVPVKSIKKLKQYMDANKIKYEEVYRLW